MWVCCALWFVDNAVVSLKQRGSERKGKDAIPTIPGSRSWNRSGSWRRSSNSVTWCGKWSQRECSDLNGRTALNFAKVNPWTTSKLLFPACRAKMKGFSPWPGRVSSDRLFRLLWGKPLAVVPYCALCIISALYPRKIRIWGR